MTENREVRTVSSTGAEKGMKPARFDLIPVEALTTVAELYGRGAEKYEAHNWRRGYEWSKSYAALQRHATQFWAGEDIDEEMDLPHLAAVAFHALALLTFMTEHPEMDDRFKPKPVGGSLQVRCSVKKGGLEQCVKWENHGSFHETADGRTWAQ